MQSTAGLTDPGSPSCWAGKCLIVGIEVSSNDRLTLILGFTGPHTELGFKTLERDDKNNGSQAITICLGAWIPIEA